MAADSGIENIQALIPNVGSRRPPVRKKDHTMFCCWKQSVQGRCEATQHTRIERERERQRGITLLSKVCATVTNEQQPLQKVTKSLYIVTHLGQLPFILFT